MKQKFLRMVFLLIFVISLPNYGFAEVEYIVEDFNDMITVVDTGFNDFCGNTGIINKDGIPYIEAPITIIEDEPRNYILKISFDFTKGNDYEAFTGIFMSLFGLTDTLATFDGKTTETVSFSNFTIDFKNIFGELQESPKGFEEIRFYGKGTITNIGTITLRVELKDNKEKTAYSRIQIGSSDTEWKEFKIRIDDFRRVTNIDLHHVKLLNFIIERNHIADNVHNPDQGIFYLDNIRLVDSDDSPINVDALSDIQFLELICKRAFQYFLDWESKDERSKGLIQDRSTFNDLLTIGGVGFWFTVIPIGIEREWISREVGRSKVKKVLEILADDNLQGPDRIGKIGYKGFFYHFLGIDGKRKLNFDYPNTPEDESLNTVELSIIDTALCLYGIFVCREYFNTSHPDEIRIRELADYIYKRVEWDFMLEPNSKQFYWGWKPNEEREGDPYKIPDADGLGCYSGTIEKPSTIDYYTDEAYLISLLSIGSPSHPVPAEVYCSWKRTTNGGDFVKTYPGTLFPFFFSSLWINTEKWGGDKGTPSINWYKNSQKAILASRNYCIATKDTFLTYGTNSWGPTACEGPDDEYRAYGVPPCALEEKENVEEDGTIAPYGPGSVIIFGDEIADYSISALRHFYKNTDLWRNRFGLGDAYNLDVSKVENIGTKTNIIRKTGSWYNHVNFAIDNGPLVIAISNYIDKKEGKYPLIWKLTEKNQYILTALEKVYNMTYSTSYTRECEYPDEYTVGKMIWRSNASNKKVHGQFGCNSIPYQWFAKPGTVTYKGINLYGTEHLYLKLRYSKYSDETTAIEIYLDDEITPRATFIPEDQRSWNRFTEITLNLGSITTGIHNIKFYTRGQEYGVADLDKFTLYELVPEVHITKTVKNVIRDTPFGTITDALSGDIIEFKIYLENIGFGTATDVVVTDIIPAGLTYIENSISDGGDDSNLPVLKWTIGEIAPSGTRTCSFKARVD